MKIYDLKENNNGSYTLMNYGYLENLFDLSMLKEEKIYLVKVKDKEKNTMILRYTRLEELLDYAKKNYELL